MYDFCTSGTNTVHDCQSEREIGFEDSTRALFRIAPRFGDPSPTMNMIHYD